MLWFFEITKHTTFGGTTLDEVPLPSQRSLLEKTQNSQETGIDDHDGILTHNPGKPAAAEPRLIDRSVHTMQKRALVAPRNISATY